MELKNLARELPDEIWTVFEPLLPPVVWVGNGRPPCSNRDCLHGVLYVLVTGIPWEMMPKGFPSYKTCSNRFKQGLALGVFQEAWRILAQRYECLQGINWDQICLDGSKHPSKKGVNRRAPVQWIAANPAPTSTSPRMAAACPWGR
jgi:transposase